MSAERDAFKKELSETNRKVRNLFQGTGQTVTIGLKFSEAPIECTITFGGESAQSTYLKHTCSNQDFPIPSIDITEESANPYFKSNLSALKLLPKILEINKYAIEFLEKSGMESKKLNEVKNRIMAMQYKFGLFNSKTALARYTYNNIEISETTLNANSQEDKLIGLYIHELSHCISYTNRIYRRVDEGVANLFSDMLIDYINSKGKKQYPYKKTSYFKEGSLVRTLAFLSGNPRQFIVNYYSENIKSIYDSLKNFIPGKKSYLILDKFLQSYSPYSDYEDEENILYQMLEEKYEIYNSYEVFMSDVSQFPILLRNNSLLCSFIKEKQQTISPLQKTSYPEIQKILDIHYSETLIPSGTFSFRIEKLYEKVKTPEDIIRIYNQYRDSFTNSYPSAFGTLNILVYFMCIYFVSTGSTDYDKLINLVIPGNNNYFYQEYMRTIIPNVCSYLNQKEIKTDDYDELFTDIVNANINTYTKYQSIVPNINIIEDILEEWKSSKTRIINMPNQIIIYYLKRLFRNSSTDNIIQLISTCQTIIDQYYEGEYEKYKIDVWSIGYKYISIMSLNNQDLLIQMLENFLSGRFIYPDEIDEKLEEIALKIKIKTTNSILEITKLLHEYLCKNEMDPRLVYEYSPIIGNPPRSGIVEIIIKLIKAFVSSHKEMDNDIRIQVNSSINCILQTHDIANMIRLKDNKLYKQYINISYSTNPNLFTP